MITATLTLRDYPYPFCYKGRIVGQVVADWHVVIYPEHQQWLIDEGVLNPETDHG